MSGSCQFDFDYLDYCYKDILLEIYAERLLKLIYERPTEGNVPLKEGLVKAHCTGCFYECSSQIDHDICTMMNYREQIEYLLHFALGEVDEIDITQTLVEHLSASCMIRNISPSSPHSNLLSGQWRQNVWLLRESVCSELIDKMCLLEYFRRFGRDSKLKNTRG